MTRYKANQLPQLVESFFREHLQRVRGASPHTVRAYRDTLRLLFIYLADTKGCSVADLQLSDLHVGAISTFLAQLESQRGNKATTRNCRLAAIRCFFKHLLRHDPTNAEQYHRVLSLPSKKSKSPLASYLEPEDVRLILQKPNRRTSLGRRDYALLLFLYNTGARVSEALAVRVEDLDLVPPAQVTSARRVFMHLPVAVFVFFLHRRVGRRRRSRTHGGAEHQRAAHDATDLA